MRIRFTASLAITCALAIGTTPARGQSTVPGWTYAVNISFDSGGGAAERGSMAMRYRTSAKGLRMEILQVGGTTTIEYVELSNAPLDAAMFAVPADYHVMDMRKMMAGMPRTSMDSVFREQARRTGGCTP